MRCSPDFKHGGRQARYKIHSTVFLITFSGIVLYIDLILAGRLKTDRNQTDNRTKDIASVKTVICELLKLLQTLIQ